IRQPRVRARQAARRSGADGRAAAPPSHSDDCVRVYFRSGALSDRHRGRCTITTSAGDGSDRRHDHSVTDSYLSCPGLLLRGRATLSSEKSLATSAGNRTSGDEGGGLKVETALVPEIGPHEMGTGGGSVSCDRFSGGV